MIDLHSTAMYINGKLSGCYTSCGDIYSSLDKAWVNLFWNWVTNSTDHAQSIADCKSMTAMLKNCFSDEYAGLASALVEKTTKQDSK